MVSFCCTTVQPYSTALVQDCIQKAKQLSDLEEQVPNKSEILMYFSGIRRCKKGR